MAGIFKLHRLGSDPEFGFIKLVDTSSVMVPAVEIIKAPKKSSLNSFIGMDSHTLGSAGQTQTTAELRPPPAYNIWLHLSYIAYGISEMQKYLDTKYAKIPYRMYAQPALDQEFLGGHIHVSGFIPEPPLKHAIEAANQIHMGQVSAQAWNPSIPTPVGKTDPALMAEYMRGVISGELTTPILFWKTMNYLAYPFECWIQPWQERSLRFGHYANQEHGHYFIRWLNSQRPNRPRFNDWAYVHMEYRTPSTWMVHPWLAYAYFALAKLTALNWGKVWARMKEEPTIELETDASPQNAKFRSIFFDRLSALKSDGLILSSDLRELQHAIDVCQNFRSTWFANKVKGIDVEAWRAFVL